MPGARIARTRREKVAVKRCLPQQAGHGARRRRGSADREAMGGGRLVGAARSDCAHEEDVGAFREMRICLGDAARRVVRRRCLRMLAAGNANEHALEARGVTDRFEGELRAAAVSANHRSARVQGDSRLDTCTSPWSAPGRAPNRDPRDSADLERWRRKGVARSCPWPIVRACGRSGRSPLLRQAGLAGPAALASMKNSDRLESRRRRRVLRCCRVNWHVARGRWAFGCSYSELNLQRCCDLVIVDPVREST